MNKMFTAVAIAQLVEAGAVDWDDTVGRHLPDYPNARVRDEVTVEHLLTHSSGMGSHFTAEFMDASKLRFREPEDYLPLFVDEPLAFAPGSKFSYSNAGFFVLGLIVEAASGENYFDYVREHVYRPAGMLSTDSYDSDGTEPNLAMGYYVDDGTLRENTLLHSVKGTPAGGGYSTVGDLLRFALALREGRLLSPATLARMTTWHRERGLRDGVRRGYGYGFTLRETADGLRSFGHAGGFPGINGILEIYVDSPYVVAALANVDGGAERVAARARDLLPRR
jgi:CubicO group peptidase (beta-lactamase class C family)